VAIHSTALGPAMGGLRIRRYDSLEAATVDALRLARAMTLKNAAAGLALGGGKAVLMEDGRWHDRLGRLRAFAGVLERLGGRYITAEDVGTTPEDMDILAGRVPWVAGRPVQRGGRGDPSPATARTVFGAIEQAVAAHLDRPTLAGVRVGVLGAGKVGSRLVAALAEAGALVEVADMEPARAAAWATVANVRPVALEGFLERELDVLAPCALGELIGVGDVPRLRCRIVAGAANNPLVDRATAVALHTAGILYVPDFMANSGGIVHVGAEPLGLDDAEVERRLEACVRRTGELLVAARESGAMPMDLAVARAQAIVRAGRTALDHGDVAAQLLEG
jgi:leucine dehydrogenase